jgi:predicted lipoprotein with Yx(FWY)xxD motif
MRAERLMRANMTPVRNPLAVRMAAVFATMALCGTGAFAQQAELTVVEADFGEYVADAEGRALYLFTADEHGDEEARERTGEPIWPYLVNGEEHREQAQSACYGDCAAAWPPLVADAAAAVDDRVEVEEISIVPRRDDLSQVAYAGRPLYYFVRDAGPGDVSGQGVESFGGAWYLVSPDGEAIESID